MARRPCRTRRHSAQQSDAAGIGIHDQITDRAELLVLQILTVLPTIFVPSRYPLYRVLSDEFVWNEFIWDEDGEGAGLDEALSFGAAIAPVLRPREAAQSSSVVRGGIFIVLVDSPHG
jgi:hypothetical protein